MNISISSSIPEKSRLSLEPSPELENKGSIPSALYVKRKNTTQDFAINTAATSLAELDDVCKELPSGRVSCPNSAKSTNDGSRWSFDSRILSRNQSLESDFSESEIVNTEKISGVSRTSAENKYRDMEMPCSEIIENIDEEAQSQSSLLSRRFLDEEEKLRTPKISKDYQSVQPTFDLQDSSTGSIRFSNECKTVTHNSNTKFSTIFANKPLPTSGKVKFSVRVDHATQEKPKLYVGIAPKDFKGKGLGYKPGCYFISTFSKESFINRLHITKEDLLPKQGQVITVFVDVDAGKISFEVENKKILEGRLALSKTKINEFYPCVALGDAGGSVSFV